MLRHKGSKANVPSHQSHSKRCHNPLPRSASSTSLLIASDGVNVDKTSRVMGSRKFVPGLWCSGLLGRASRGPGASAVGAERATQPGAARTHNPHSDTQGHTKQEDGRSGSNKGAPDGEVAGRSRGARAGACGCGGRECECVRACVSVRSRRLTRAGRGSGSPRQGAAAAAVAGGQGRERRALRTPSLHMEEAFLDD